MGLWFMHTFKTQGQISGKLYKWYVETLEESILLVSSIWFDFRDTFLAQVKFH